MSVCVHVCVCITYHYLLVVVVVQLPSCVQLFVTPMDCSTLGSLSLTISWRLPKFTVVASNYLIHWCPQLLPSNLPSNRDSSSESAVRIRWPKYWSFNFSISPFSEYSGLISLKIDWFDLLAVQGTFRVFSSITVRRYQFFGVLPSLRSSSHNCTWPLGRL